jgi:hypothetical protein
MYRKSLMVGKRCANESRGKRTVRIGVERNEFRNFRRSLGIFFDFHPFSGINKNLDQEWHSIISSTPLFKMLKTSSNKTFSITFTLSLV